MSTDEAVDVVGLLHDKSQLVAGEVEAFEELIASPQLSEFRRAVDAIYGELAGSNKVEPAQLARAGVASYLLGRHQRAVNYLEQVADDPVVQFHLGLAYTAMDESVKAEEAFKQAVKTGYDKVDATLRQAGAVRRQGRLDEAEQLIRSVSKEGAGRAEYSYQIGCIRSDRGDTMGAIEYFARAVDTDPHHSQALFKLAQENALRGDDEEAIKLYEQSLSRPPHYLGALLNLGLLYEDAENYPAAAYCFRRILDTDPTHQRATLYLKDIEATSNMYYDEDTARLEARLQQLLKRPITDFELSVRSRNCLQAMNIFTLGDLTETSESELLAGKNFGETSLSEIQELMATHGLSVGQNLHQAKTHEAAAFTKSLTPQEQEELSKPVGDLNLSVRSRKCMSRLGISTVGELIQRTPDELLGSRNFGVTSLNEIRQKLAERGMKLRND